jgi:hypothetical protein
MIEARADAVPRQGEKGSQNGEPDRDVATPDGDREREACQPVSPGIDEVDHEQDEGAGDGLHVEVVELQPVQRRVEQERDGQHRGLAARQAARGEAIEGNRPEAEDARLQDEQRRGLRPDGIAPAGENRDPAGPRA